MSFAAIPAAVVAAGAVLITAVLFALQRLRAQRRVIPLAGAALWLAAAQVMPRRTLFERFSNWLSYLLALAIALLVWSAAADPEWTASRDSRFHYFYLDASAPMLEGGAFVEARNALIADAAAVPAADREVDLGGSPGATLLNRGESLAVLRGRLSGASPAPRPSGFERWLGDLVRRNGRDRPATVHYYGSGGVARLARGLPASMSLDIGFQTPPPPVNRGIVALGASPAASGASDKADVLVRWATSDGSDPGAAGIRFELDGNRLAPTRIERAGSDALVLRDVDAAGGTLGAFLVEGDRFGADDAATLRLPDRRVIGVAFAPGTPGRLRDIALAGSGFEAVDVGRARAVVRFAGQAFGGDLPALELSRDERGATFAISDPDAGDGDALRTDLEALGVGEIDAGGLADQLRRPVSVTLSHGRNRTMTVWAGLFDADAAFAKSRMMPLFLAQSLRWLARPDPWIPFAQAGTPLVDQSRLYGIGEDPVLRGRRLNGEIEPAVAGPLPLGDRTIPVSLGSDRLTRSITAPGAQLARPRRRWVGSGSATALLLVLALLLLAIEWRLLLARRIP